MPYYRHMNKIEGLLDGMQKKNNLHSHFKNTLLSTRNLNYRANRRLALG